MKELFLSFRPEYFKPLLYGIKKYEYRKKFCDEETLAYLYLSGKSRQVVGVMHLGKAIRLDKTRDDYIEYPDTLRRVDEYISTKYVCAVPIISLRLFETPISLDEIRKDIPNFMPPQMYYVLDNHPRLKEILHSIKLEDKLFLHKHNGIYYDNLANDVYELEKSDEFKKIHEMHMKNNDYSKLIF